MARDNKTERLSTTSKYAAILGGCQFIEAGASAGSAINHITPPMTLGFYLNGRQNPFLDGDLQIKEIKPPAHGTIVDLSKTPRTENGRVVNSGWFYCPDKGFGDLNKQIRGKDTVEYEMLYKEKLYKVIYTIYVTSSVDGIEDKPHIFNKCNYLKGRDSWRIGQAESDSGTADVTQAFALLDSFVGVTPGEFVAAASGLTIAIEDLPGVTVAQETVISSTAQITLSPTAAGHGWYIDPTPLDNTDDFLPTADAAVWQAKPGSLAFGKMDMLSVLLHEYGHVLGLEHSANPRDFMGATLLPGVRRLPTPSELAQRAKLAAQMRAASAV